MHRKLHQNIIFSITKVKRTRLVPLEPSTLSDRTLSEQSIFGSSPLPVVRQPPAPYFKIENIKVEKQQQIDLPLQVRQKQEPDVYFNFSQHA